MNKCVVRVQTRIILSIVVYHTKEGYNYGRLKYDGFFHNAKNIINAKEYGEYF
jgi:hypothetical protein